MNVYVDHYLHSCFFSVDSYFLLEKNRWNFVENIHDAKIIIVNKEFINDPSKELVLKEDQIILIWFFETIHQTPDEVRNIVYNSPIYEKHNKILSVHTNKLDQQDPKFINFDIMFNREKLYYTDYRDDLCYGKMWVGFSPKISHTLGEIDKKFDKSNKLFLAPTNIRLIETPHNNLKKSLKEFVEKLNCSKYQSNPCTGTLLPPNGYNTFSPDELEWFNTHIKNGAWAPISDFYYNTSYITLAIESSHRNTGSENNNVFYVCEKYFDHLIKGNFPLIFSSPNYVKWLKEIYGFKFPNWIDYSYDSIENDQERFESYCNSIEKISKLTIEEVHDLYLQDKHILDHNRNVFYQTPYDSLYDKIKHSIKVLGW